MIVKIKGFNPINRVGAMHSWANETPVGRVIVSDWDDAQEVNLYIFNERFCVIERHPMNAWLIWEVEDM